MANKKSNKTNKTTTTNAVTADTAAENVVVVFAGDDAKTRRWVGLVANSVTDRDSYKEQVVKPAMKMLNSIKRYEDKECRQFFAHYVGSSKFDVKGGVDIHNSISECDTPEAAAFNAARDEFEAGRKAKREEREATANKAAPRKSAKAKATEAPATKAAPKTAAKVEPFLEVEQANVLIKVMANAIVETIKTFVKA